jgi:uncharacterized protein (DUF1330 family)
MSAYVIVNVNTRDPQRYETYKKIAQETVTRFGGRYLVRGGEMAVVEGTWKPTRIVVLEFESFERAQEWWRSEDYAPAKQLRQSISDSDLLIADGFRSLREDGSRALYSGGVSIREFQQGETFRLPISFEASLFPLDQLYAELTGPDDREGPIVLKSTSSIDSMEPNGYIIDGPTDPNTPCGFYEITKLERGDRARSVVQAIELPAGSHGILIVPSRPHELPPVPKVKSVG